MILEGHASYNSAKMASSRVRNVPSQADIPTDIIAQATAHLDNIAKSWDLLKSVTLTMVEIVNSYQVLNAIDGLSLYNQLCSDFSAAKNGLDTTYQQFESWISVTSEDRGWGHQLLALFEPFMASNKSRLEVVMESWVQISKALAEIFVRRMSEDELRNLFARMEALLEQRRAQQAPEIQMLADMLDALDIDADDN